MKRTIILFLLLTSMFVCNSQTTYRTVSDGVWGDGSCIWDTDGDGDCDVSDTGPPLTDFVGSTSTQPYDSIIIEHDIRMEDGNDRSEVVGPVVLWVKSEASLSDSSAELGYSTSHTMMEFKTKSDINGTIIMNDGVLEFGKKIQIEFDDSLYNTGTVNVGGELHFDGYICNSGFVAMKDSSKKFESHGARYACGGTVITSCFWKLHERYAGDSVTVHYQNFDTCHFNCGGIIFDLGGDGELEAIVTIDSLKHLYCGMSLPINLLRFRVWLDYGLVNFEWITSSEVNNDYFEIERSMDLISWEFLAEIKGAGNTSEITIYNAQYSIHIIGIEYFRLIQYDFDGTAYYYPSVPLIDSDDLVIEIWANPSNGIVNVMSSDDIIKFTIYNVVGQKIEKRNAYLGKEFTFNLFTSGMYTFVFELKNETVVIKHIVR